MSKPTNNIERLMKRCQIGVGGRHAIDDAHDIMAECYGTLGKLSADLAQMTRERDALRAEVERLRETLTGIRDADYRKWEELASPYEFVTWAKRRANFALQEPTP